MKVEYSKRATADLRKVSADSRGFGVAVAIAVEKRIRDTVAHLADDPEAFARVVERPGSCFARSLSLQDLLQSAGR